MPVPDQQNSMEVAFDGGFHPLAPFPAPAGLERSIKAGNNVWLRTAGVIEPARGLSQVSATNVGARLFAANTQRASIAGSLSSSILPYAGFLRLDNGILLYLSQDTSAQVYLDETAVTGLTTSSTAGRLRVAVPDGGGGYNVFDAGFDKPTLTSALVSFFTFGAGGLGQRPMTGAIGVAIAPWRTKSNAIGPPSEVVYNNIPPSGSSLIRIDLPSMVSGQDGWIYCGTKWGDQGGQIRIARFIYTQARGTFTATNGSPNLTAGVGTQWFRDLRAGDLVDIDGGSYQIFSITSNTAAALATNFTGSTAAGKTMTITDAACNWYDSELLSIIPRDIIRPPRAAGILQYGDRVFLWGIPDTNLLTSTEVTGNAIAVMLDNNPEHIGLFYIRTASGANLVNVLGGDGPLYLMTTAGLEVVDLIRDLDRPYVPRIVATPGFKAGTNGCLHLDYFYGFNGTPFRTKARSNIDTEFAREVQKEMEDWDGRRVMVNVDPINNAVLYAYDDGSATTVRVWMEAQEQWGPPINLAARVMDMAVVNGALYVTYLSGGNIRVNQWEGGTFIGGTPYVASNYLDANRLNRNRVKKFLVNGKIATTRIYAALPGAPVPDVTNSAAAAASFTMSDAADMSEPEIGTDIKGRAFAARFEFSDEDGKFDSCILRGTPVGEQV